MNNRKSLTKSLHTVTAVSRLAAHIQSGTALFDEPAVRRALAILGQPSDWHVSDPTMAACIVALAKLRA